MACAQIEVQNTSSSSSASASRPPRFTMEGVGARVIRGPDWKWGKQVSSKIRTLRRLTEHATSSDSLRHVVFFFFVFRLFSLGPRRTTAVIAVPAVHAAHSDLIVQLAVQRIHSLYGSLKQTVWIGSACKFATHKLRLQIANQFILLICFSVDLFINICCAVVL